MTKVSLSKTLLLAGSILILALSCTNQKKSEQPPKGPEQEPFENCECTDCECEEGAASDVINQEQPPVAAVVEETPAKTEEVEQVLTVTPVVVESVKIEEAAATVETSTETPVAQNPDNSEIETVSVQKIEVVVTPQE